jgi:hypothetical protein
MCIQTSKNVSHLKQQKNLNKWSEVKTREMINFLESNSSKKNSKLSRVKPIKRNSESASMRETLTIILRDGFQYFAAG